LNLNMVKVPMSYCQSMETKTIRTELNRYWKLWSTFRISITDKRWIITRRGIKDRRIKYTCRVANKGTKEQNSWRIRKRNRKSWCYH
jgi:hypothetical protein